MMEKRALGRGLAALMSESGPDSRESGVRAVPIVQITPNPYQPRTHFDSAAMQDLIDSIKTHGVIQPVLVRMVGHERFQLIAGERRFRAASEAGLTVIPAIVRDCSDQDMLETAIIENVQREDIGPMEAARAYRRMIDEFGMTQDTVAQRVGKNRSTIANTLRLLLLAGPIQESIERGEISEGHGRALLMAEDESAMLNAWQSVTKRQLSVRDTENLVRELRKADHKDNGSSSNRNQVTTGSHSNPVAQTPPDPHEAHMMETLQQSLKTRVILRRTGGGMGKIEIEFYSYEDLERLIELLVPVEGRH